MIEMFEFFGADFRVLKATPNWKIGWLRYSERFSEYKMLERHLMTDESFVLLEGEATLYTDTDSSKMKKNVLYNIPKGVWHHITVSKDATVIVVENSDTSKENTERIFFK